MKTYFIEFVVLVMTTGISCKKDNQNSISPPAETKALVTTIAGDGTDAFADGPALAAKFHAPVDVAVNADGIIYVADFNDHRIRKIVAGQVSTLAGNDTFGIVNGKGVLAQFKNPYRISLDTVGNLYILDQVDSRIRKISLTGDVSTYTGTNTPGFLNGPLPIAQFQVNAGGIAGDEHGNIYIGDTFNERIRKISISGEVITLAGNGTEGFTDGEAESAEFRFPNGISVDRQDNLYVVDAGNFCIRKITKDGVVSRFAGSGIRGDADGIDRVAQFDLINDIVVDNEGNLYVTDDNRIRKITAQGTVSTIAGSTPGYADGDGVTAKFKSPGGLGIDKQGNIYVADINNNRIRKISFE